jgi:N6-adenosine-specific RNA methylase IME4
VKKYNIILADPPWLYKDRGCSGAMGKHYSGMTIDRLRALRVQEICDKNAALFLWATYPMLQEALALISAWGFSYKGIAFQWVKMNRSGIGFFFGVGRYTRHNTEPCLLGIRGKMPRQRKSVDELLTCPVMNHSRKPSETHRRIEGLFGDLPRIELFARRPMVGWDVIGNEITGNDIEDDLQILREA